MFFALLEKRVAQFFSIGSLLVLHSVLRVMSMEKVFLDGALC